MNVEEIISYKVLPICLSHIKHCQQVEKKEKIAYHYAVSNRNFEIMYLKKISSRVLPFVTRQNDFQCKYVHNELILLLINHLNNKIFQHFVYFIIYYFNIYFN